MRHPLDPTPLHRLSAALRPAWLRTVAARRVTAALLVMLAAVAAWRPDPADREARVVVAVRDLRPGVALTEDDVRLEPRPAPAVPDGAATDPAAVVGRSIAGPTRRGEVLTDVRLLGERTGEAALGVADARAVALHLADSALLDLVRSGDVVDVLAAGRRDGGVTDAPTPHVVAAGAVVVLVSPPGERGSDARRVVLVALPAAAANTVAGIALTEEVTVTLR